MFVDQRASQLANYFSNIRNYYKSIKFNIKPWVDFFLENKHVPEEEEKSETQSIKEELNPQELVLKKINSQKDAETDFNNPQSIFNFFQKQIIPAENNLVHHLYKRPMKFLV